MAKPLCRKGFPLFDKFAELVDGICAMGQDAFQAGQPTPALSTQDPSASVSTSYEPVIDPQLLEISSERGPTLNRELDCNVPQVICDIISNLC
jgi:hypothetical protein